MKNMTESKRKNRRASANGISHQAAPPIKALQEVQGTQILVGSGIGQLTLRFEPSLEFVIVQFKCPNENLKLERGAEVGDDCGFCLTFKQGDQREVSFDIRARAIEKESYEPVEISCHDKDGKALGGTRRHWIKLKPEESVELPDNLSIPAWLLYAIRRSRKHPVFYLLIVVMLAVPLFIYDVPPTGKIRKWVKTLNDPVQIRLHTKDPIIYSQSWSDTFPPSNDNRPDQSKWLAPEGWSLVNGENDSNTDKALRIDGSDVGINKLPSDLHALYDYEVSFPLNISENQRSATWVVRAQSQQDYYLFELTLPTSTVNELKLDGYVYRNGIQERQLTDPTPAAIGFFKFHEGDLLTVTINVKDFTFKHGFNLKLHNEEDFQNPNFDLQAGGQAKTLTDLNNTYRYGAFGFQARDSTDAFKVERVDIEILK